MSRVEDVTVHAQLSVAWPAPLPTVQAHSTHLARYALLPARSAVSQFTACLGTACSGHQAAGG